MANLSVELVGWEKIVTKYGEAAAKKAVHNALKVTTVYTADLVKVRLAGKHHVTGFLISSIIGIVETDSEGKTFARPGGSVYYAKFVERGTGIYGPRKAPIRPTKQKAMAWHPKTVTGKPTGGARIVRRSVKGQQPVRMFKNTFLHDKHKIRTKFQTAFKGEF